LIAPYGHHGRHSCLQGTYASSTTLVCNDGILGWFYYFSAFSLEVVLMIEPSQYFSAAFYGLISIVLSVMAAFFGVNFIGLLYQ